MDRRFDRTIGAHADLRPDGIDGVEECIVRIFRGARCKLLLPARRKRVE